MRSRIAIVTGNSRGIGLEISNQLRRDGYFVPNISRTDGYDLMQRTDKLIRDYPKCSVLVNNCGGMGRSKLQDWKDCMHKNYGIAFELTMHYVPEMANQGFGRVITISSIHGLDYAGLPWFNAAKGAQIALNKSLAGRYEGVTFNTICPGMTKVRENENHKLQPDDIANLVSFLASEKARYIDGQVIGIGVA